MAAVNGRRGYEPKPEWLRKKISIAENASLKRKLRARSLTTVCESARCPNISECFSHGLATIMILGENCTRSCPFCAVKSGAPPPPDRNEPQNTAEMIKALSLRYAVITAVTRDDLPDGGAAHFARTVRAVRQKCPKTKIELLIPDFRGDESALKMVMEEKPDVLAHNVETVPSLYRGVRPQADFEVSLTVLRRIADYGIPAKSGIMIGLGETEQELMSTVKRLKENGVELLTLGQYLAPSRRHARVVNYRDPAWFDRMAQKARETGIKTVFAGPYVRSSYMAETVFRSHLAACGS